MLTYVLLGIGFTLFRLALYVVAASVARSHGQAPAAPQGGWVAYVVSMMIWPLEAAVMVWKLAGLVRSIGSQWLAIRRLRKADH